MKRILLVLILITSIVYAQEYTVTPDGLKDNANLEKTYVVINTPGKTAEQNYNNAMKYINKTYKSPKDVIKGDVKGEYISFDTHVSNFLIVKNSGVKVVIDANYTVELSFKGDRVKLEVINIDMYILICINKNLYLQKDDKYVGDESASLSRLRTHLPSKGG